MRDPANAAVSFRHRLERGPPRRLVVGHAYGYRTRRL